jgi:hypothetical protein
MFHGHRLWYVSGMTNSEQDPGYRAWITGLMSGTVSEAEQAARARFRAIQARKAQAAPRVSRPVGVEATGRNVWAVSAQDGDDGLTTFTHLAGPGIPGLIAAR